VAIGLQTLVAMQTSLPLSHHSVRSISLCLMLLGIVAGSLGGRPGIAGSFGREARDRLAGLVENRWVRLEYENETARSARAAYVFLEDGRFVNEWLVREGLARVSTRTGLRRARELLAAEAAAKASHRGIWGDRPSRSETYRMRRP
jgi:endonuclease YncB( thermonuclease family)